MIVRNSNVRPNPVRSSTQPCWIVASILLCAGFLAAQEPPVPITFPADSGIVNVTDFGAFPNDDEDDTAAIQAALDRFPGGNRIVYLPPGVYVVTDTLRWPDGEQPGQAQKRVILQGAGESLSILRLPEGTSGFSESTPKPLIWTGSKPAQRFRNAIRDLTIEIEAKNRTAIGMQFNATNQGGIRNVTIRAAEGSGRIGLDLGHTDEIGPLLVRNLTVDGFDLGISTKWPVNSNTFEHVRLMNQRRYGWWNYHQMIFVRGLISEGESTVLYNEKNSWGSVLLMDSHLHGVEASSQTPGIFNQRQLVLRDVEIFDYRKAIDNSDRERDKGDITEAGLIVEDTSHANVVSPFRKMKDGTLAEAGEVRRLPVKETPDVPWGDPTKDWANLLSFGADPSGEKNSSPALQRAIDSGKKTIFLPAAGDFRFEGEVRIRGPVERIIGLEGRFTVTGEPVWKLVDGDHPEGMADSPIVIIERLGQRNGGNEIKLRQESQRTLVISSVTGFNVEGHGTGDLFIDDLSGHLDRVAPGQNVWCRQLNSERRDGVKCRNMGGNLWILGMRAEHLGTVLELTGGGHTEVNGLFVSSSAGWNEAEPAFLIRDSTAALFGVCERNTNRSPVSFWVSETQEEETKELRERPWVYLSR